MGLRFWCDSKLDKHCGVLCAGASAEKKGLTGVWAAVKYLITIGSSEVDLIKQHSRYDF